MNSETCGKDYDEYKERLRSVDSWPEEAQDLGPDWPDWELHARVSDQGDLDRLDEDDSENSWQGLDGLSEDDSGNSWQGVDELDELAGDERSEE